MKNKIAVLILTLTMWNTVAQQEDLALVGLGGGYVQNGFALSLDYDYYLSENGYIQGQIMFSFAEDTVTNLEIKVPYNSIYINAGYFHQVVGTYRDKITFNIGGGISFGYEILNNGDKELSSGALITSDSKFVLGAFLGLESKFYINDKWTGVVFAKEYYHNSEIGNLFPYFGASILYTLF